MPKKPLTIGDRNFVTQGAAIGFIRNMLNSQPLNTPLTGAEDSFLRSLIARHPRGGRKIGAGIHHFSVGMALFGTRCFYLHRTNGTQTDFSYLKCLRGTR